MATFDMKDFARRGAEARLAELNEEIEAIHRTFPELRGRGARKVVVNHEEQSTAGRTGRGAGRGPSGITPSDAVRGRKRRKMSAAQRKAVGERMKKYWAARRAESAAKKR